MTMTTIDEWMSHYADHGPPTTVDELRTAMVSVGRNPAVTLLADLVAEHGLHGSVLAGVIGNAWSGCELPNLYLDNATWRWLFKVAGYTVDGKRVDRPTQTITLWRGATSECAANWSWTDDRDMAARYASGAWYRRTAGVLWRAEVEPWRLLARNTGRGESEYVVDTDGLVIEADPDAAAVIEAARRQSQAV